MIIAFAFRERLSQRRRWRGFERFGRIGVEPHGGPKVSLTSVNYSDEDELTWERERANDERSSERSNHRDSVYAVHNVTQKQRSVYRGILEHYARIFLYLLPQQNAPQRVERLCSFCSECPFCSCQLVLISHIMSDEPPPVPKGSAAITHDSAAASPPELAVQSVPPSRQLSTGDLDHVHLLNLLLAISRQLTAPGTALAHTRLDNQSSVEFVGEMRAALAASTGGGLQNSQVERVRAMP